jgi:hypothetical protein
MSQTDPRTVEEIVGAIERLAGPGLDFWSDLEPERFAAPLGEAWSPADNVRHLVISTKPVAKAFKLPALALRMRFGKAERPSDTYAGMRERYRARLALGADAGEYAPKALEPPLDAEGWQRELVGECRDALVDLASAVSSWSDADLDLYQLPHPLLGLLTLREMLFFTIYHYSHHAENARRRLDASSAQA